jgi:hypothetical protein
MLVSIGELNLLSQCQTALVAGVRLLNDFEVGKNFSILANPALEK